jgi:hypothetical protein
VRRGEGGEARRREEGRKEAGTRRGEGGERRKERSLTLQSDKGHPRRARK